MPGISSSKIAIPFGAGGVDFVYYWTTQTLLKYTGRSEYDLVEQGGKDAKILPSVGIFKPTDYIYHAIANFESADTSGYVETRFYFDGTNDIFMIWSSGDEGTGGSDRHFYFYMYQKYIYLQMRSNTGTVFQNICKSNTTINAGWYTIRWTSAAGAYALTINGQSTAFTVTGVGGGDNGRWLNLITGRDNIGIGYAKIQGSEYKPVSSGNKIDYVDYNNKHKWIVTGAGNRVFDIIGTTHLTWTGTSHQSYDALGSTLLLDSGYSVYSKTGDPNEIVPYKAGSPYDVSGYLTGYEAPINYAGGATIYNYAPSLIDFDYSDTAHADLVVFDKSNATHHIATVGMLYYDATNVYRWRNDEMVPAIYSTAYKNVGYKGMMMAKAAVTDSIPKDLSEIYVLKTDQTGNKQWKLAELCTVQDLAEQSGGLPVYDANNYLTFFFSMSSYPDIAGDGVTDDFAAIQGMINAAPVGVTIQIGESLSDVYLISQPIYFRSNRNYVINGEIKIVDGETDVVLANIATNDTTFRVTTPSKFVIGQYVSVTDDNYTLNSEGVSTIRGLRYAWGGKIVNKVGDVITLEGACPVDLTTAANAVCGHSQGCIILDTISNVNISGSGIIEGNRYNQIAVLPSLTNDLLGYWENQRCGMGLAIFQCDNVTVDDIKVQHGLVHGIAVSAKSSGFSTDIILNRVKANASHDKNILVRFTDGIDINDCSADGNPLSLATPETWEDGLIFYSNCFNCRVDGFVAESNRRSGFVWNSNSSSGLTANNITTRKNGTRTGNAGFEINAQDAVLTNIFVYDDARIGGVYTTNDITITNLFISSIPSPGHYDYNLRIGVCDRVVINNLIIQDSTALTYAIAAAAPMNDCAINGGSISNQTGTIISQTSYDLIDWTDFTGLVIS